MAEISLSAYQNELERLLGENRYDEVIAHARHILKTQPKNLRAYQQLGDALVASGRWEEAGSLLRRALGAQPQDFRTHSQLARVFERLEQYDRAIWHAERALDQKPNDQETISLVRELYRVHRQEEIDRLQLSAAALTQQHIRANLLTEALDTLAAAMENNPQRIDLQLLRARALWLDGQRMDAAEAALDILDRLPYAIDANRIMTELWLTEQRPSDAQLYLKRIEDLDPYLAHQMATGEEAPETLLQLERLDYSAMPRENQIVNPEWLDNLGEAGDDADENGGGLGALLGIDGGEPAPAEKDVTADLDDLLSDEQLEDLFSELVIGEPVASVSEAPQNESDAKALLDSMEEQGFIEPVAPAADESGDLPLGVEDEDDAEGVVEFFAQASAAADETEIAEPDEMQAGLDDDLTDLLERLDSSEEDGGWMAEIQGGSLELEAEDESLAYLDDFEREWVQAGQDEDAGGAPWLSAAMREAMDKNSDSELDLFGEDEQLQDLLKLDSDTEPLRLSDIEDWITAEPAGAADEAGESALDIDDDLLHSPPGTAWLEADEAAGGGSLLDPAEADDPNQLNAELIDGWGAELGEDYDDDPYVDWLRDDPRDMGDGELRALSAPDDEAALATPDSTLSSAKEQARAWGLDDADQLADFVEDAGGGAPDWLNAVVPGLDRENDASTEDVNEYARPMSSPGKEFAWVSDIVQEETGEMNAIDPDEASATPYFRFSNPPAWLTTMQDRAAGTPAAVTAVTALSLDEDIEGLNLDDLTFDDYFNFDTPTDKLDAISLDEDTQQLSFASLEWDDYFDLESPTEKTIAITLDEDAESLNYDALGVDDADFDFEKASDETSAVGADFNFDDIGLGDDLIADADQAAEAPPAWLNYDKPGAAATDDDDPKRSRRDDQTTL